MMVSIYARCSTNKQDLDTQLFDLRAFCKRNAYQIYKEYTDVESGSKEQRKGLNQLMEDAHKKLFDIVLVWRFDRFSRSLKQLITSLEYLRNKGIKFISYNDNIDTTSASGELMFNMIGSFAQFERRIIQERVRAGLRKAKIKGIKLGRPILRVNKYKVVNLRNQGKSIRQIAEEIGISIGSVHQILSKIKLSSSL